ncbi:MAG: DUF151 domain-containing protein [Zestosphaera sp.]
MSGNTRDNLVKVIGVEVVLMNDLEDFIDLAALSCYLENNEVFTLYNVPREIALTIEKLNNSIKDEEFVESSENRGTIFDVLLLLTPKLKELRRTVRKTVINSYDVDRGTYSASLHMKVDGVTIQKNMIPSHAIFLSLLLNRPIYVTREVLEVSRKFNPLDEERLYEDE